MTLVIDLKPEIEAVLTQKAQANGFAITDYVENLIEKDVNKRKTLNEIFAPFQKQIEEQEVSDEELDGLFTQARRDYFKDKTSQEK